jgi:hypothetical protein
MARISLSNDREWAEIIWHDGNLKEIKIANLGSKKSEIELLLSLYSDRDPSTKRTDYILTSNGFVGFSITGKPSVFEETSINGNIDEVREHMYRGALHWTLCFTCYGGQLMLDAKDFFLEPIKS